VSTKQSDWTGHEDLTRVDHIATIR